MWERAVGALGASESSAKPATPPRRAAPPPAQETSTPGSKVVQKFLYQSARKELLASKGRSPNPGAPPTKTQGVGDKKPTKKAKTASDAASEKRKIAPDSSETVDSDPLFEDHNWVSAAKHIPKKKKKKVGPALSSEGDSNKLPSDTMQDVKALATEVPAGSED